MPAVHCHLSHITRSGSRISAARSLAYILRAETKAQQRETTAGRSVAAQGRYGEDFIGATYGNLPDWAQGDPFRYYEAADAYEGTNRRLASMLVVALPRDLSRAGQWALAEDLVAAHLPRHPYVMAFHETTASDGKPMPHVHILYSERITDGMPRTAAEHFRLYQPRHPERGGAQKDPYLHQYGTIKALRVAYTDLANMALEREGRAQRLDPRSLQARGIGRPPEKDIAPYHAITAKYRGTITQAWQAVLDERAMAEATRSEEDAHAGAYWEQRKREGYAVVMGVSRTERVAYVTEQIRRDAGPRQAQGRTPASAQVADQWRAQHARITGELVRHETYAAQGKVPTRTMEHAATKVLATSRSMSMGFPEEDHDGGTHYRAGRDGLGYGA